MPASWARAAERSVVGLPIRFLFQWPYCRHLVEVKSSDPVFLQLMSHVEDGSSDTQEELTTSRRGSSGGPEQPGGGYRFRSTSPKLIPDDVHWNGDRRVLWNSNCSPGRFESGE